MKYPNTNARESLELRLRTDAPKHRRTPSRALHTHIMTAVRGQQPAPITDGITSRPLFVLRRLMAAAAMVLIAVLAALMLRPNGAHGPSGPPSGAADTGAPVIAEDPHLVQPLLELAPRLARDLQSPWAAEADRMLADAQNVSRIIIDNLPFRGRADVGERPEF